MNNQATRNIQMQINTNVHILQIKSFVIRKGNTRT